MIKLRGPNPTSRKIMTSVRASRQAAIEEHRYDFVRLDDDISWFKELGQAMGIDIDRVDYSVGGCQGDGACFTGTWGYEPDSRIKIRLLTDDEGLWRIADGLAQYQAQFDNKLSASIYKQSWNSYHERTVTLDLEQERHESFYEDVDFISMDNAENEILDLMREFMRWMYDQLEQSYEAQTSDEHVAECLEIET